MFKISLAVSYILAILPYTTPLFILNFNSQEHRNNMFESYQISTVTKHRSLIFKMIMFLPLIVFLFWMTNFILSLFTRQDIEITSSEILSNVDTQQSNAADLLHRIYSPMDKFYHQKYPLYFSLEEKRLEKLYDSLGSKKKVKTFLKYGPRDIFTPMNFSYCHASECEVVHDVSKWREADALVLTGYKYPGTVRPPGQLWFTLIHESPVHGPIANNLENEVNFTISFRRDSTIYAPYGYYEPYIKNRASKINPSVPSKNFASNKTKMVAWFVSNCNSKSPRMQYAEELSKNISVDIYGDCGTKSCPRNLDVEASNDDCFKMIRENYKFYLSFENSLCKDYITEKLFRNAFRNDILPIVMGASIEEYEKVSPPYSFIHVDQFESPAKLAEYLKYLDKNDTAYNEYFAWHGHGIIHDWDSQPQCAMCLLAHTSPLFGPYWIPQVARWWNDGCNDRSLRWRP